MDVKKTNVRILLGKIRTYLKAQPAATKKEKRFVEAEKALARLEKLFAEKEALLKVVFCKGTNNAIP